MQVQMYKQVGKAVLFIWALLLLLPAGTALAGAGCEISTISADYKKPSFNPQDLGWARIQEIEACDYVQVEVSLPDGVEWETPMNASSVGNYIYIKDGSAIIDGGIFVDADEHSYVVRFDQPLIFGKGVHLRAAFNGIMISSSAPDKIGLYMRVTGVEDDLIVWQVQIGDSIGADREADNSDADNDNIDNGNADEEKPASFESNMSVDSLIMHINGEPYTMDAAPYIKADRTYLPVRFVCYALGMDETNLAWDQEQRMVRIKQEDTMVELQIGSNIIKINGEAQLMDVAPEIAKDRTMLPIRFLAEVFGAEVSWDEDGKTVSITI